MTRRTTANAFQQEAAASSAFSNLHFEGSETNVVIEFTDSDYELFVAKFDSGELDPNWGKLDNGHWYVKLQASSNFGESGIDERQSHRVSQYARMIRFAQKGFPKDISEKTWLNAVVWIREHDKTKPNEYRMQTAPQPSELGGYSVMIDRTQATIDNSGVTRQWK